VFEPEVELEEEAADLGGGHELTEEWGGSFVAEGEHIFDGFFVD